ncbi:hypothetical protein K8R47_02405, partial [archaeon]|nr:hypothetical protein [archaeon]
MGLLNSFLKSKALLQVLIIICSIFTVYLLNTEEVFAQDKVCCEKTLDNSPYGGDSCVYTEAENCEGNSYESSPLACEQTTYCQPVCCIDQDTGECSSNVLESVCEERGGSARSDSPSCQINQCQQGCCLLPDTAQFVTQAQCSNLIENYQGLIIEEVFDSTLTSELECLQASLATEEGCCILPDSCEFGTRGQCNTEGGDFNKDIICSYIPLGCEVTEKHHLGCMEEGPEVEVYWFDSSDNIENIYGANYRSDGQVVPKEDVLAQNNCDGNGNIENVNCGACDFNLGSICGEADDDFLNEVQNRGLDPNKINYMCQDLNCHFPNQDYDKLPEFYYDLNPFWEENLNGRDYWVNGETWCVYEGATGFGQDLVGSRHYRGVCLNGEIKIEACESERNKICVQNIIPEEISGVGGGISGAVCKPNNGISCLTITSEDYPNEEDRKEACEDSESNCFWDENIDLCLPMVPLGGNPEVDGVKDCDIFGVLDNGELDGIV